MSGQPFGKALAIARRLEAAGNVRIQVGLMGEYGAAEPGDLDDPDATVLDIGYLAEFGRPKGDGGPAVPAREPLHTTFERERDAWSKAWAGIQSKYLTTGEQRRPLVALGLRAAMDVQNTYAAGMSPPLSEYTKARRKNGGDIPFVDTGQTMRSNISEVIDWEGNVVVVGQGGGV